MNFYHQSTIVESRNIQVSDDKVDVDLDSIKVIIEENKHIDSVQLEEKNVIADEEILNNENIDSIHAEIDDTKEQIEEKDDEKIVEDDVLVDAPIHDNKEKIEENDDEKIDDSHEIEKDVEIEEDDEIDEDFALKFSEMDEEIEKGLPREEIIDIPAEKEQNDNTADLVENDEVVYSAEPLNQVEHLETIENELVDNTAAPVESEDNIITVVDTMEDISESEPKVEEIENSKEEVENDAEILKEAEVVEIIETKTEEKMIENIENYEEEAKYGAEIQTEAEIIEIIEIIENKTEEESEMKLENQAPSKSESEDILEKYHLENDMRIVAGLPLATLASVSLICFYCFTSKKQKFD